MTEHDDNSRYIEYLQEGLVAPGWEGPFDSKAIREWYTKSGFRQSGARKTSISEGQEDLVVHLERHAREFEPGTRFERPETGAIFGPLLERVKAAAAETGLKPVRGIRIATSTEIGAGPLARPTSDEHLLFIGPGTWAFCNYWAKAATAVVKAIARVRPDAPIDQPEDLESCFRSDPSGVVLASRLALYYGTFGTLLGFGEVEQARDYLSYRINLLDAVETFVVAHEFSHFVAEERLPELTGHDLERFCDEMGLQLSRHCAYPGDGWLGFTGVGALVFFRSMELCERVRHLLHQSNLVSFDGRTGEYSDTHPPTGDRIAAIKENAVRLTLEDQRESVRAFLEEYDRVLCGLGDVILDVTRGAIRAG